MLRFAIEYAFWIIGATIIYFAVMSVICATVFLLSALAVALVPPWNVETYLRRTGRLGLFVLTYLIVGTAFSCLWSSLIWGHLYYSADYCGMDFLPFWPISRHVIDDRYADKSGQLFGITFTQLRLLWALFAIGTWAATFTLYCHINGKFWFRRIETGDKGVVTLWR